MTTPADLTDSFFTGNDSDPSSASTFCDLSTESRNPVDKERDLGSERAVTSSLRAEHGLQWEQIQQMLRQRRMTQSLLLVARPHLDLQSFVNHLVAVLLCAVDNEPCGLCDSCHLLQAGNHPDQLVVEADTPGGVIKVDQIRVLQDEVYQTPKRGARRLVVMRSVDKLNRSAANALLKILEEPPSYLHFILVAEQLGNLPETLLSRCQRIVFPDTQFQPGNYLALGAPLAMNTDRFQWHELRLEMLHLLGEMMDGCISPCALASQWSSFALVDVISMLYLFTAQAVRERFLQPMTESPETIALRRVALHAHPTLLLKQLDKLIGVMKKISQNRSMNTTLTLEDVLIGYEPRFRTSS